jgi:hypothetical protein
MVEYIIVKLQTKHIKSLKKIISISREMKLEMIIHSSSVVLFKKEKKSEI